MSFGFSQTCGTTISTFPYSENFESSVGAWTQGGGDNFDWTRDSGGTPSSNTGPTTGDGDTWYMYIEASNPNYPSRSAHFDSPCFNITSVASASFSYSYHMYGANVGSLSIQISTDNGATFPTTLRSFSGNLGNTWNQDTIDLSSYVGQTIKIRFRAENLDYLFKPE